MRARHTLALFGLMALGSGCIAGHYVHDPGYSIVQLAGTSVVFYNLGYYQEPPLAPFQIHRGRSTHLGVCRVDLAKRESSLVEGERLDPGGRYDRHGRRFELCPTHVHCLQGDRDVRLLETAGANQNLDLVVAGESTWLFWIERAENGSYTLVRFQLGTREVDRLPLPTGFAHEAETGGQTLSAQNGTVAYVVETRRSPLRRHTWRGDFATRRWAGPIDGSFRVIDRLGTLLERRGHSWRAGKRDAESTRIEIIRAGRRQTADLGLSGWADPVFDTGYVRLWDPRRAQFVFRSLEGKADFWVPRQPDVVPGKILRD